MALEHLILLRHGETDWNAALRMQGGCDIPLNDTGFAQASAAAPSVAALRPDVVVSSDLSRARATADAIAGALELPVGLDERLRETSLGDWEGMTRYEVMERWPGQWEEWRSTTATVAPPGGESRLEVADRAGAVVDELDSGSAERALLVTHGGVIVGLTGMLLGLPHERWNTLIAVANCHWVVLHRVAGEWRLHTYNGGLGGVVLPEGPEEIAGD